MNNFAKIIGLGLLSAVAACGGGGGGEVAFELPAVLNDQMAQTLGATNTASTEAMTIRVFDNSTPTGAATPTIGSAIYEGFANVILGEAGNINGAYVGEAVVNVNFANQSVTGGATDFTLSNSMNETAFADGDLTIQNGMIGENGVVTATIVGVLTTPGITTNVNNAAQGLFSGSGADGIGITTQRGGRLLVNGNSVIGNALIVGERPAS